jgi:ribosome recycling factor
MLEDYLKELRPRLEKALEHLTAELANVHTGRASTSLVEDILVDAYGTKQPIKAVANISIPEPRQILIHPWDKGNASQIESAIRESNLGLSPVNAGDVIRVNIPELTEERRKEFVKVVRNQSEEAKVAIRNARQDVVNEIKKDKTEGNISEDEMYRGENEIQKEVDKYNKKVEELLAEKEKELLEI